MKRIYVSPTIQYITHSFAGREHREAQLSISLCVNFFSSTLIFLISDLSKMVDFLIPKRIARKDICLLGYFKVLWVSEFVIEIETDFLQALG